MAGYGLARGLSYKNDWDKDIDRLYQRAEYAAQVRAEKERKTLFYANLLKKGHGSTPRTEKELEEFYSGVNNELADFVTENPNFETDPGAMQEFLNISDKYLNNDILRKDLQVKQEFDKLRQAISSGDMLPDKADEEMKRYNAYINSQPGDPVEPYVFTNYKTYELNDIVKDTNERLKGQEISYMTKDGTMIRRQQKTSDSDIAFAASVDLQDPNKRLAIEKNYKMVNDELKTSKGYRTVEEWYSGILKNGEEYKDIFDTWNVEYTKSLQGGSGSGSNVPFVFHNVLNPLNVLLNNTETNAAGEVKYIDGEMSGNSIDKILTLFSDKNSVSVTGSDGIKVWNKQAGRYDDFLADKNTQINYVNTNKIVVRGGKPYVAMTVSFDVPLNEKNQPSFVVPEEWNFASKMTEVPGNELASLNFTGSATSRYIKGQTYTGVILAPLIVDETRAVQWEKEYLGLEHTKDVAGNIMNELYSNVASKSRIGDVYAKSKMGMAGMPVEQTTSKPKTSEYNKKVKLKDGRVGYYNTNTGEFVEEIK